MRVFTKLSLLLAATSTPVSAQADGDRETGELGDAAEVTNNPAGVTYRATLPESAFFEPAYPDGGNIQGEVTAVANPDGHGVLFTIKLSNLPATGGPFPYHIHVDPVPTDGNCTKTLAHLDPYIRGEATSCDASAPETCQVGDLSGKHGSIPADVDSWETSYVDLYASTLEGIGAFFGNRSIVFHYPNKTRISCASFEQVQLPGGDDGEDEGDDGEGDGGYSNTSSETAGPTSAPNVTTTRQGGTSPTATETNVVTAAAAALRVGVAGAAVVGAGALFML